MTVIYLIVLFIAPQLWIEPLVGLRTDLLLLPLWALYILFSGKISENRWLPQDYIFLLFIAWIVITAIVNGFHFTKDDISSPSSVSIIIKYTKWFVIYKLISLSTASAEKVKNIVNIMTLLVVVLAIQSIDHKYSVDGMGWASQPLGWVDNSVIEAGGSGRTQWINIFDGPGVFCVVFTLVLPFVLQKITGSYNKKIRLINLAIASLLLVAIFYTGSRGGFLATLIIFGLTYVVWYKVSMVKVLVAGILLSTAFTLAPAHLTNMNDQQRSASHRVEMWAEGIEMAEQNPLFGIGKGQFAAYTGKLVAHNSAIEIMGELGFIGLLLWTSLIYISLKTLYIYRLNAVNVWEKDLANGLGISILGYIASSMFVTLEYETQYLLYGLVTALIIKQKLEINFTIKDIVYVGLIVIAWYMIIKLFVMMYFS